MVKMWMCILVRLISMCGPSSMSNANVVVMLPLALVFEPLDTVTPKPVAGCKFVQLELASIAVNGDNST